MRIQEIKSFFRSVPQDLWNVHKDENGDIYLMLQRGWINHSYAMRNLENRYVVMPVAFAPTIFGEKFIIVAEKEPCPSGYYADEKNYCVVDMNEGTRYFFFAVSAKHALMKMRYQLSVARSIGEPKIMTTDSGMCLYFDCLGTTYAITNDRRENKCSK